MHPFFSNQINRIRSVCIISYPFLTRGSPAVPNIGSKILSREISVPAAPFFPLFLSLPLFLFSFKHSYCFPTTKLVHAKYVKKLLFLVPLFTLHSVRYYVCLRVFPFLCFLIHSHPMLQSWRGMESTIGPQYFSED